MKEQSWWSNNALAVSIAAIVFIGLTAGAGGVLKWFSDAFKTHAVVDNPSGSSGFTKRPHAQNSNSLSSAANSPDSTNERIYGPYMRQVQNDIKAKWYPPKRSENKRVTVTFRVDRKGNLANLTVSPSGDEQADQAARRAVLGAAPFAPLPSEFKEKSVDIQFTFDYNVHKRRD